MKLINTADLRLVNDQYLKEEITFSRAAELLNEIANKKLSDELSKRMPEMIAHIMDTRNSMIYKVNRWTDKQIADALMNTYLQIKPIQ